MPPEGDPLGEVARSNGSGSRLAIMVSPRSGREGVGPVEDGRLRVRVTAAAVDNAANVAVVQLLAQWLDVPRSSLSIERGQTSRRKLVSTGLGVEGLRSRLSVLLREG